MQMAPNAMMQPQIILLKEGTDTSQGKGQLISNINALMVQLTRARMVDPELTGCGLRAAALHHDLFKPAGLPEPRSPRCGRAELESNLAQAMKPVSAQSCAVGDVSVRWPEGCGVACDAVQDRRGRAASGRP